MLGALKRWRRERVLAKAALDPRMWRAATGLFPFVDCLGEAEHEQLRRWVILFLHDKSVHGAAGLTVTDEMRLLIAIQACMLILNLDLDYYRGWVEVIVYPEQFVPRIEYTDDAGVVHVSREPLAGESWSRGPVILSWADVTPAPGATGYNVVMHEFAHQLDMLNGPANGFPPLHPEMNRDAWSCAFRAAYDDFRRRVEADEDTAIDPYAAENPAEFFAVLSEAFFEMPSVVRGEYPAVYSQLTQFYRQDPAARVASLHDANRERNRLS